ncbi:hypothetical protein B0A49_07981, partial [Cryomyces minteri]
MVNRWRRDGKALRAMGHFDWARLLAGKWENGDRRVAIAIYAFVDGKVEQLKEEELEASKSTPSLKGWGFLQSQIAGLFYPTPAPRAPPSCVDSRA